MTKGTTGAAAGGGALYGLGIFGALFYYWQQANSFWEYVWAIFPEGNLLACVHGIRGVQGPRRMTSYGSPESDDLGQPLTLSPRDEGLRDTMQAIVPAANVFRLGRL